jgi:hypothetical protein
VGERGRAGGHCGVRVGKWPGWGYVGGGVRCEELDGGQWG